MKNKRNNLLFGLLATVLLVAGCNGNDDSSKKPSSSNQPGPSVSTNDGTSNSNKPSSGPVGKTYTYYNYTTVSPSNWNELTYQDNNDTQVMSYIGSSFYTYDFKFDDDGEIIPGDFEVEYSAALSLEDVTEDYAGDEKWGIAEDVKSLRAYKITLRDDLKWDDGTPIHAEDFVYTMKEQLSPLFWNYRADSFYVGSTIIHNAEIYLKQGTTEDAVVATLYEQFSDAMAEHDEIYFDFDVATAQIISWAGADGWQWSELEKAGYVTSWFALYQFDAEGKPVVDAEGKPVVETDANGNPVTFFSKYNITAENNQVKVTDEMFSDYGRCLGWKPSPEEEFVALTVLPDYTVYPETFDFADVGLFVGDSINELVLILDKPLQLLKEDGSLSYKAAYNLSSLPLVKKDLYESCKQKPQGGSTLWTSNYNSSLETTASWGPYKLVEFQAGKHYTLARNENWYGYNMDEYAGQYQTDKIEVETIKEWNTAWLKFLSGDITAIGIDVSVAEEYKNSERAIFTPDDYVGSMQLQSDKAALRARESENVNKTILAYPEFRKAISLAVDRDAYNNKCTTSSLAGYGIFNSMHYHDVENGAAYRESDYAKRVLCEIYGVNPDDFETLDEAVDSITGYDLDQARELVDQAYDKAFEAGDIDGDDIVVLTFGSGADNEVTRRVFNFLSNALTEMVKGTKLEGRLQTEFEDHQTLWADDFRDGLYDICTGGWTGAAWDPGYFLLAYLSPDYMYSTAWDTATHKITFTMPELENADYDGEGTELTMGLLDWYACLNGATDAQFNWAEGAAPVEARLALIARLEKEILAQYYTVPISYSFGASLLSYQVEYITTEYNTFMGYGGIRYMTYNYDDAAWAEYAANHDLEEIYKL